MIKNHHDIISAREEFGQRLRQIRHDAGLSLRALGQLADLPYSMISSMETADRATGAEVAVKLADGLGLSGEQRDEFLLKAAATRKKDRLVQYARRLAPEIVNYVAKALVQSGICLDHIKAAQLRRHTNRNKTDLLVLTLMDGKTLICSLVMRLMS